MVTSHFVLATEDELSESVGHKLIQTFCPSHQITLRLRQGGNGYLRSRFKSFCEIASRQPVLLITDLDSHQCPPALLARWSKSARAPSTLMVRVAVREIESWLLADHHSMKRLLGLRAKLPEATDEITDPKGHLLSLAKAAARDVRRDLCADAGAIASQGIGYNRRLAALVSEIWDPIRARKRSPSLDRACLSLERFS